jgi:hypothetical protein
MLIKPLKIIVQYVFLIEWAVGKVLLFQHFAKSKPYNIKSTVRSGGCFLGGGGWHV